jgi:hypothetical protein
LDLNALAMPSVDAQKKADVEVTGDALARQGEFIRTTQTIKLALQALMTEIERLGPKSESKEKF